MLAISTQTRGHKTHGEEGTAAPSSWDTEDISFPSKRLADQMLRHPKSCACIDYFSKWSMYFNFSKYPKCVRVSGCFTTLLGCFVCCNWISLEPPMSFLAATHASALYAHFVLQIFVFITSFYDPVASLSNQPEQQRDACAADAADNGEDSENFILCASLPRPVVRRGIQTEMEDVYTPAASLVIFAPGYILCPTETSKRAENKPRFYNVYKLTKNNKTLIIDSDLHCSQSPSRIYEYVYFTLSYADQSSSRVGYAESRAISQYGRDKCTLDKV
ncbi:hypothetical protein CBL_04547 [Carabus blaptoides fortunei]